MIQRIQTLWLLLGSLTLIALLFIPIVNKQVGGNEFWIMIDGMYQKTAGGSQKVHPFVLLLTCALVSAAMCFLNIFTYKNRLLQKRVILINILLIIGLSFWCRQEAQILPGGLEGITYQVGVFLPTVAILFCLLALSGINKDEKLIRSADRLR